MLTTLDNLLNYQNPLVLHRYSLDSAANKAEAEYAFDGLLKFLWLSQKHEQDKAQYPLNPDLDFTVGIPKKIDDMWHTFLLFTRDYADFCNTYFGCFVHHQPTSETVRLVVDTDEPGFYRFHNYVYANLGQEAADMWFKPYSIPL